jgi:serine/threonine protein kinase
MAELREAVELSTGELLDGRYRLDERVGEGATARVFRAEDTILGRTVAVKILRAPVDGLSQIERALSETSLLASLNHHALVTLFDAHVSELDGSYLVMEYVEGITLRERIAAGPVTPEELASLTVDMAEALHIAHSAGIVHRDIKPSNVLLWRSPIPGREWRAKIADFGIAHLLDSNRVTTPGTIVGTAAYVAPEQARGAEPAPSADIYSLGLLLIEALTGTRPFGDAEGIGTVVARLSKAPTIPGWLDEGWQQLLRGMTSMAPTDRPTALEVIVAASHLLPPGDPTDTDHPTVAMASAPTGTTAVLPLAAAVAAGAVASRAAEAATAAESPQSPVVASHGLPSTATVVAASEASSAPLPARSQHWRPLRDRRRRRRTLVVLAVLAALVLASLVGAALWLPSSFASPDPLPSTPVEEQIADSPVEESPSVVSPAPVEEQVDEPVGEPVDEPVGTSNSGPGNSNGKGNENSGPGNNNGKGNGNGKGG